MRIFTAALVSCATCLISFAANPQQEPWIGTWVLNHAKSHSTRPGVIPRDSMVRFEHVRDMIHMIETGRDANGRPFMNDYMFKYDGKGVPGARGAHGQQTAMFHRTGGNRLEMRVMEGKKNAGSRRFEVNGRNLTVKAEHTGEKGDRALSSLVYQQ